MESGFVFIDSCLVTTFMWVSCVKVTCHKKLLCSCQDWLQESDIKTKGGDNTWRLISWCVTIPTSDWSGVNFTRPLIGQQWLHCRDHMKRSDRDQAQYQHKIITMWAPSAASLPCLKMVYMKSQCSCHTRVCGPWPLAPGTTPCLPIWWWYSLSPASRMSATNHPWALTTSLASDWSGVSQHWPPIGPHCARRQLQVSQLVEQLHSINRRTFGTVLYKYTVK